MADNPAPVVPTTRDMQKISLSSKDAPISSAVVFIQPQNKAEIRRVISITPKMLGLHEVELVGLPGPHYIDEQSVTVSGSGYCTILDVSLSNTPVGGDALQIAEKEAKQAETEEMEALQVRNEVLGLKLARSQRMRQLADAFADRATSTVFASGGGDGGEGGSLDVEGVDKALEWWAEKAVQTDDESHCLKKEQKKVSDELHKRMIGFHKVTAGSATPAKRLAKVVVGLDVEELGPIDMEVKYMIRGATWSPAYDLRVDTQTDSMSCTYYGRVSQSTGEDWDGVALSLSTAEPTVRGTPPSLGNKTVSLKPDGDMKHMEELIERKLQEQREEQLMTGMYSSLDDDPNRTPKLPILGPASSRVLPALSAEACSVPPPPPAAQAAIAQVEGGGGAIGAVSFVIGQPAIIKNNGSTKKLTIGVLELSAEVTHYIVPAKASAAYLQAKATNNTDYLLLASDNVSIFFDNSFVAKTSLRSVSPGESFQTFLGIDPAVKTKVAPPRKTAKRKGVFGKIDHVTHVHSTSMSNAKKVHVTCVVVDAMPRSTDEIIKVSLEQPNVASVHKSDAITDETLVTEALEIFGGEKECTVGTRNGRWGSFSSSNSTTLPAAAPVKTGIYGVSKSTSNHLAWVVKIAPQDEIQIPFKYTIEWPLNKEVQFDEQA